MNTTWLKIADFLGRSRWIVLSLVLALVGLFGAWVDVPRALNVALAIASLLLLWREWRHHVMRLRELDFGERSGDAYRDVKSWCDTSTRFDFIVVNQQHVVLDRVATGAIAKGGVQAALASTAYVLPVELEAGIRYRSLRVGRRGTYNGHLLGLNTNLGGSETVGSEVWELMPARYWDHLASDIMASKLTLRSGEPVASLGRSLSVDPLGHLRDFGDSWLLNGVGTSLLAITTDLRLVLVSQSALNESSGGLLAPSASGSLEPQDMGGVESSELRRVVARGALRELGEETAVLEPDVGETAFLGFGRWVEKSAKPEMWSVATLKIDSHEVLRRRIAAYEKPFTTRVQTVRLAAVSSWDPNEPALLLAGVDELLLSVPLLVGLRLMAEEVAQVESPVGALIRRAMLR